ncbi:hypothetical protein, partial [Paraburkholderia sp. SIMBA_053]|uniref:hypothetical protein n=1 Tax=Paraburkholderia sp. SIMBA_053 TaxID=3085794 RepID=UPI00397C17A1
GVWRAVSAPRRVRARLPNAPCSAAAGTTAVLRAGLAATRKRAPMLAPLVPLVPLALRPTSVQGGITT